MAATVTVFPTPNKQTPKKSSGGAFARLTLAFMRAHYGTITFAELKVYTILLSYARIPYKRTAFVSQATLAKLTGSSIPTVKRAIAGLVRKKIIATLSKDGGVNTYLLLVGKEEI